jgi:hypothetical protein
MPDRLPDSRTINFAGDIDELGHPLRMTVEVLRARTEKWPLSPKTPGGVASHLARSRQMFIDGYYTYDNLMDGATRSLQAVEAALRVRFEAGEKVSFHRLIKRAHDEHMVDERTFDVLDAGRRLRNSQIHATTPAVITPAMAAGIIGTSHELVAEIFGN